ncbi:transposase [Clostridium sp. UBA6640]|uniref:transposase n=1 Tax=Clostridium sp. UBA6640 TaxID=1946370 RepID=UPI0039C863D2
MKNLFPVARTGRPPKDNRAMFNVTLWIARSSAAWRGLPERFSLWKTVYSRLWKWRDDGTLLVSFKELISDADYEDLKLEGRFIFKVRLIITI